MPTLPSDLPRARRWRPLGPAFAALLACCVGASTLASPRFAHAETVSNDTAHAVQLNETGSELYAAGNYPAALHAFQRAYALIAEPNLLFNIAGCHERLGQRTQAVEYYRWFLDSPNGNPEGRRRAIEALSRLDAPPPPAPVQAPPPPVEKPSAFWPLATLGAGILLAGFGAGLYVDGAHDHNEVTNAPGFGDASGSSNLTEVEAKQLVDSGDTKKLIGGIGIGVGTALIVTHVAITLWRSSDDEKVAGAELRLIPGGWSVAGKF
ncbi:MAG TPA: tetratricopeptide repeat protein [Polyangiaceae bacterium]|nr:tetratricopeptide repeat protein [Polyangiaceae bacterium]